MQNFMLNLLKKKKKGFLEARQTLKILGVAISNHIISFQYLPIFGRLKKTKIVWSSAEELAVTGEKSFFIISKEKIFRADWKESLLVNRCLQHYFGDHGDSYISSPLFYFSFAIIQSQPASIAWTVTSTAAFYHCWKYTEHSGLWIRCVVCIWY